MNGPKVQVVLQRLTGVADGSGGFTDTWADLVYINGSLVKPSGNARLQHGKREIESTHIFFYDYPIGVTPTEVDQLKLGSRLFEITYVENPAETSRHVALYLNEIV